MAAITSVGETPLAASGGQRSMQAGRKRRLNLFRYVVLTIFGLFFVIPLAGTLRFSLQGAKPGSFSLAGWREIASTAGLPGAIGMQLLLAGITCAAVVVLLLPTMIWIRLKVPGLSRSLEFLCLLPLTIPAIVLVVGLGTIYNRIERYSLSRVELFWVYVILALPYAYRALITGLNAIDAKTLSEAGRSLGANWLTVMVRIIVPNMGQAILNALLLSSALVLGEFTIAEILNYDTLPVVLFNISRASSNATVVFSTSLASLAFAFVLLLTLSYAGRRRRRGAR
jgi:putative spermidine/putrescine transport system permease protein